jgi:hypothetical protein
MKAAKPTRRHRLAIVPGILGTVYAVNEAGEARYFDYDRAGAEEFAGVAAGKDVRYSVPPKRAQYVRSGAMEANPRPKTKCVWVLR